MFLLSVLQDSELRSLGTSGSGYSWSLADRFGYGLWPPMVLLDEIVQTFIVADFCYYYVKSVFWRTTDSTASLRRTWIFYSKSEFELISNLFVIVHIVELLPAPTSDLLFDIESGEGNFFHFDQD